MKTNTIRRWVDRAGLKEVARLCGVGVDTVGRWTAGARIPKTRVDAVRRTYDAWLSSAGQKR